MKTVTKAFLRYIPRRPVLSMLQVLGVACGVAAAVGMAFSSQASLASFSRAVEFLKGQSTHSITRPAGPMEEQVLARLMEDPDVEKFSPVIDRRIQLESGEALRVLGIDPFLDRYMRPAFVTVSFTARSSLPEAISFLLDEKSVFVDSGLAEKLKLTQGDTIKTRRGEFTVAGIFPNPSGEPLILMDISRAQNIFDLAGRVDRIELIVSDEKAFKSRWEQGFIVQASEQKDAVLSDMLNAYRLNLEALSLLALFVGVFLIYNTAMFAVVSRKKDAGILRSLGARQGEVVFAFLVEILFSGILGGALGGVLGHLLSQILTGLVGKTISSLYFFLTPAAPAWTWLVIVYGMVLGCGASLAGGFFPLVELARTDPIKALQGRVKSRAEGTTTLRLAAAGCAVLLLSLVFLAGARINVYLGFAGAFFILSGASLITGLVLTLIAPVLKRMLYSLSGLPGKIAAANIRANLGRTAIAIAAFMVALSMLVGLGSMIGSFRSSVQWWMNSQLAADLYIAPSADIEVPETFYDEINQIKGIGGIDTYRNVPFLYQGVMIRIAAVNAEILQKFARFGWLSGKNENWNSVKSGGVIVSESFYRRFRLTAGDTVTLNSINGPEHLKIAGVFYDYTSEHGLIMMDRSTYLKLFDDRIIDSVAVFIEKDNPERGALIETIRKYARRRNLPVVTQKEMHGSILTVFDSTFAVTRSMRLIAIVVAFFGIANALLTLFIERQREFGIYRALGFSTLQVAGMTLMEGIAMGLVSFMLCAVVGTALAFALIKVINFHSFNWTVFYFFEWKPYLLAAVIALLASIGAAVYPVWRICRLYPQMQIREE
jgi:putative ABC transport system permease protein